MSSFKATWLGDGDPNAQIIHMGGLRFIRGEETLVPSDNEFADLIKGNPTFKTSGDKTEVAKAEEPSEEEQVTRGEEGTVKAALKSQLRARGVEVKGNPSEDTLRAKLAEATKSETEAPAFIAPAAASMGR